MEQKSKRDEIIEVINKLFIFVDFKKWNSLTNDVFTDHVMFDESSLKGEAPSKKTSKEMCKIWQDRTADSDATHHHLGNYIVTFNEDGSANAFCYAIALHYKKGEMPNTTQVVGSYDFGLALTDLGWRINGFKFNLKYISSGG